MMEGQCNYFVIRKRRYCRMTVRSGEYFCGEHAIKSQDDNNTKDDQQSSSRLRMACPLDPKHTCFVNKLENHLKVCNAKEGVSRPYIVNNCNLSDDANDVCLPEDDVNKRSLANVSEKILGEVVALVEKIYENVISGKVSPYAASTPHPCVEPELNAEGRGVNTKKHLLQTSSLIRIIEAEGLTEDHTCYVELGAGKGQVSYYLFVTFGETPGCSVLLVDRASHRHKQDNKLADGDHHERVRADISHLLLKKVPVVELSKNIVAVSKHLCGVATDLALRCVTKEDVIHKTKGVVMATCCHHQCTWKSYVGKSFLQEQNVTPREFNIICGLVSWATCGSGLSRERRALLNIRDSAKEPKKAKYDDLDKNIQDNQSIDKTSEISDQEKFKQDLEETRSANVEFIESSQRGEGDDGEKTGLKDAPCKSASKNLGLSFSQREEVGFKAKAILDWGRMLFLEQKGFKSRLTYYVGKDISPENVCIVATKVSG